MEWRRISEAVQCSVVHTLSSIHVPCSCAHVWPKKLLSFSSEAAVAVANKKQKNYLGGIVHVGP